MYCGKRKSRFLNRINDLSRYDHFVYYLIYSDDNTKLEESVESMKMYIRAKTAENKIHGTKNLKR